MGDPKKSQLCCGDDASLSPKAVVQLTEYEQQRLENIKRNSQMLAFLNIHSTINDLSALTKRQREINKVLSEKKPKLETPIGSRRSLRSRGMPPDASTAGGLKRFDFKEIQTKIPRLIPRLYPTLGPFSMREAYCGDASDQKLAETIMDVSRNSQSCRGDEKEGLGFPIKVSGFADLESLRLEPENIARVVPGMIMTVRFFPSSDMKMIAAGNKYGNIGFWNIDAKKDDGGGVYLYQPHSGPVSGIVVHPCSLSKVYSSCCNGFLRLMDVEKELFDLVYSSDYAISSISQRPNDVKSLYFAEGQGMVNTWDERAGKSVTPWVLHYGRINSIDFSSENTYIMATSSTDGTACIWDLRFIDAVKPRSLKTLSHKRAVLSAYFSPSGSCLATTSFDDNVGLLTGANFEDTHMIYHRNKQEKKWISPFRAIWGWDDSYIFIGSKSKGFGSKGRGVNIISTANRTSIATLHNHEPAIPYRLDVHPYIMGMLAGGTSTGQVSVWTTC